MVFAIVTTITEEYQVHWARALANSVKAFSLSESVCITTLGDIGTLSSLFNKVVTVKGQRYLRWNALRLEKYEKVLVLEYHSILNNPIDTVFITDAPASTMDGTAVLLNPNRMAHELFDMEYSASKLGDLSAITDFYKKHGYEWHPLSKSKITVFDPSARMWESPMPDSTWIAMHRGSYSYPSIRLSLKEKLSDILKPLFGNEAIDILDKEIMRFQMCFISKSSNSVFNYELFEAFGDRFLYGQIVWILLETPGVITSEQVTRMSSYFTDRYRLEKVCDYLGLEPYILSKSTIDTKVKSDVIEALIACIGIVWDSEHKKGNWAMRRFVTKIFKQLFKFDPETVYYVNPIEAMNTLLQNLYLDRKGIEESPPQQIGDEIVISLSYKGHPIGMGKSSLKSYHMETAVRVATLAAYEDALSKKSLEQYIKSKSET